MRCWKLQRGLSALVVVGLASASAGASEAEDLARIAAQARRIQEQAAGALLPEWLRSSPSQRDPRDAGLRDDADRIVRDALLGRGSAPLEQGAPEQAPPTIAPTGRTVVVAVTAALGDAALRDVLREAAGAGEVVVVFRGVLPGERISAGIQRIQRLVLGIEPTPVVQIDPTLFSKHGVTQAPEILVFDDGVLAGRARGLVVAGQVLRRLEGGERGDFGVLGPVVDIREPDLIEVMQAKASQLDLGAARERALASYWQRARFVELDTVIEERVRRVDATTAVTRDIRTSDGRLVAAAGARMNPFNALPFTLRLVVFDAREGRQVETARRLIRETPRGRRPLALATGVDRDAGWDGFNSIQRRLGIPLYLLTEEIRNRVKLERVPAVIEAAGDNRSFVVREVPPTKGDAE